MLNNGLFSPLFVVCLLRSIEVIVDTPPAAHPAQPAVVEAPPIEAPPLQLKLLAPIHCEVKGHQKLVSICRGNSE